MTEIISQSNITAIWRDKHFAGSCNFCHNTFSHRVLVVRSSDNNYCLEVRFCPDCFKNLCTIGKKR